MCTANLLSNLHYFYTMIRKQISLWSLWIYFWKLYQKSVMKTSLESWPDLCKASGKTSVKYEIEWVIMTSLVLSPLPPVRWNWFHSWRQDPLHKVQITSICSPPTPSIYPWLADRDNYNPLKWNWPPERNWQGRPFSDNWSRTSDGAVGSIIGDSGNFMIFFFPFILGLQL